MASRRIVSFRWRLFVPVVVALWVAVAALIVWQRIDERNHRADVLTHQLANVSQHVINAYEQNYNPLPLIDFVTHNFSQRQYFDDLRVSVYLDGRLYYNMGDVITLRPEKKTDFNRRVGYDNIERERDRLIANNFYFATERSGDKRLIVHTLLPNSDELQAGLSSTSWGWVAVVIAVAMALTTYQFIATRRMGRSMDTLCSFVNRVTSDPDSEVDVKFPGDELGDIGRRITNLYNERRKSQRRMRREHEVALHAIDEKARVKRQLTSNINHELKTPIGVIKGYLDTIIQNPDMNETTRNHFVAKSLEHANRLVSLINDVSTIARLEEGASIITTEALDYHDLVYSVASDIEDSGELRPMEFVYDVPLDTTVRGNFNLLSAMLHNLAKNAAAYSKGTECGIRLMRTDGRFAYFCFYDDGVGVPPEHLPHLFERFYRVESGRMRRGAGNGSGSGLGLPIVQNTVLAHGGTITVENGEDGGLQFIFSLPLAKK